MLATNMQKWYQTAQTQGIELGLQKGKLEGKHERDLEIARNMLANGLDVNLITKVTGLTPRRHSRPVLKIPVIVNDNYPPPSQPENSTLATNPHTVNTHALDAACGLAQVAWVIALVR
jgi:hypothetical protein